jgi:AAA family ATP:ADP antiporter
LLCDAIIRAKAVNTKSADDDADGLLKRVLGIERHELFGVGWSFLYFFCILSSYYMLRPMREQMGVASGFDTIPILFSSTFVVMMLATPIFGWVASRYPRRTFLPWVYGFFALNILIFYGIFSYALNNEVDTVWIGRVFFVWVSVFNLYIVSVFWSFMADIYTRDQGRRLFGVISAGGSIGALVGPFMTGVLVVPLGFQNLMPVSACLLCVGIICIRKLRDWVQHEHEGEVIETVATPKALGGSPLAGISHVAKSPYLSSIAFKSLLASLLGTALYMFMNKLVGETYASADQRTQVFAYIDGTSNFLTILLQLLVVRHAVGKLGVGLTLAIMPIFSFFGFLALAASPVLLAVALLQGARRSIGFGFAKPSTDMLYSVVTPEEKYKAKNFVDTAVYRGGDVIGTWSVKFMWGLGMSGISIVMLPFALLWSGIALWLGREYNRRDRKIEETT